jgi:phosphate transport system protein
VVRTLFTQSLARIQADVIALDTMVEESLLDAVAALAGRDFDRSHTLIEKDRTVDERRYAIEAEALMLIATQQPAASDMRSLAAAMFIANELERIGDYAKGIARVNLRIGAAPLIKPLIDVPRMAALARDMLHRAVDAYARRDTPLAYAVVADDDAVDALYNQVYAELMTHIMVNPSEIQQANLLLMVAHNLERAADRATNICERVIYITTGELLDTGWEEDIA